MRVAVLRTYLARRREVDEGEPAPAPQGVRLARTHSLDPAAYRAVYSAVGERYNWRDRLAWSDERLAAHLADPLVGVWLLSLNGETAGYFELHHHDVDLPASATAVGQDAAAAAPDARRPCELVYFGLVPAAQGLGLGRWLLERAIAQAWGEGADMLWLHTCSLDHPSAIPNYRARGFRPFASYSYEEELADRPPAPPAPPG